MARDRDEYERPITPAEVRALLASARARCQPAGWRRAQLLSQAARCRGGWTPFSPGAPAGTWTIVRAALSARRRWRSTPEGCGAQRGADRRGPAVGDEGAPVQAAQGCALAFGRPLD